MQFLKRNGRTLSLQAALLSVAIGLIVALATMQHWMPPSAYAQEVARQIDPVVYSGVQEVRRDLALTNADLAAMGLNQESAKLVLADALDWYEANQASILQRDQAVRAAKRQLSDTYRLIHIGPRNESLMSSVSGLEANLATARSARDQYLNGLVSQIETRLSTDQRRVWQTARVNRDAPVDLRYATGLTAAQVEQVPTTARQRRADATPATSLLSFNQQREMADARESQRLNIPSVLAAEAEVLPVPPAMRESREIESSVDVETP